MSFLEAGFNLKFEILLVGGIFYRGKFVCLERRIFSDQIKLIKKKKKKKAIINEINFFKKKKIFLRVYKKKKIINK